MNARAMEPPPTMPDRDAEHGATPAEPGAARPLRWVWRVLQVVLIALVAWGLYRTLAPELSTLSWQQFRAFRPTALPLIGSTILLLAVYLAHAFLWRRIMVDLAIARPSARSTIRVYFLASLGRYIPGKLWQLAGLAVLAARAGVPPGGAAAAAVLGQAAFLTTGLVFLALLLPRWAGGIPALAAAAVLGGGAVGAWLLIASPWGRAVRLRLIAMAPSPIRPKLRAAVELAAGIQPSTALVWAAAYGATWVTLGLAFALFVSAFVPGAFDAHRHLAGTIAASYLWGYVVVLAPGGIGVREIAMSLLLAQIPGFPAAATLLVAACSRIWFTIAELAPLGIVPLLPRGTDRTPHHPDGQSAR